MDYTTLKTRILCFESNQEVLGFKTYKVDFAKQVITSRVTGIVRTSGHDSGYLDEGFYLYLLTICVVMSKSLIQ